MEREVGGGIGMGNTCKPMDFSFQFITKFTTKKKKVKKKTKKQKTELGAPSSRWIIWRGLANSHKTLKKRTLLSLIPL